MEKEIWKLIKDYPKYEVSNLGRVRSLQFTNSRVLKPCAIGPKEGNKYYSVTLVNEEGKQHFKIHRLVAICFLDNPLLLPIVNHKDHNNFNNEVSNLEWVSQQENVCHASRNMNTTSVYIGVSWDKKQQKWAAQINLNGVNKKIGRFKTELEAYEARVAYEKQNLINNKYI